MIMTHQAEIDLSRHPVREPRYAYRVDENRFATTDEPKYPHMITFGLYSCKGLAIFDPERRQGLLAHIATVGDIERDLGKIVTAFGGDISQSEITVVEAYRATMGDWPLLESIVEYFLQHDPRSLRTDRNIADNDVRAMALNLVSGEVAEMVGTDGSHAWLGRWHRTHDTSLNRPINFDALEALLVEAESGDSGTLV